MTAKTQFTADLACFFDTDIFAQSVTYNSNSISAVVTLGKQWAHRGGVVDGGEIMVKVSDVASPSYRDTVVIGGTTWRVFQSEDTEIMGDGYTWIIPIYKNERPRL